MSNAVDKIWRSPITALTGMGYLAGQEVGEDLPGAFLEADTGDGHHVIGYIEYLHFAVEHNDIPRSWLDEGWLAREGAAKVQEWLMDYLCGQTRLPEAICRTVEVEDQGGDEPNISVTIKVDNTAAMTVEEMFTSIAQPFWASLANVTDPGTFNRPYLWAAISEGARR